MITNAKKGFTLIEILIVVAIIAILASVVLVGLGPTQRQGRDSRRISDLHEVQNSLELYNNKCTNYPGSANCASGGAAADYAAMSTALTGTASIGTANIPNDPTAGKSYQYGALPDPNPNSYTLAAVLEDPGNVALKTSIAGTSNGINCDQAATPGIYCISL